MTWTIKFDRRAEKELDKIDYKHARRIAKFLRDQVARDPRAAGERLKGSKLGEFWKYRVGNYRIIAEIKDNLLIICIVRIGHRKDVYQKLTRQRP